MHRFFEVYVRLGEGRKGVGNMVQFFPLVNFFGCMVFYMGLEDNYALQRIKIMGFTFSSIVFFRLIFV